MKLFEYEVKSLFEEYGIAVPARKRIQGETELLNALNAVGAPCVLKAQVLQGGRGKAGLIQRAETPDEMLQKHRSMQSRRPDITSFLIERAVDCVQELYLSITVDPVSGAAIAIACADGGVEIEMLAETAPERLVREPIDLDVGLSPFQSRNIMFSLGLDGAVVDQGAAILSNMFKIFRDFDAELLEINPLMLTNDGTLIAVDGKMILDDNAQFRRKRFRLTRDHFDDDLQYQAALEGLPFLQFEGHIGILCAGAGLANTVFDLIHDFGGTVNCYVEFGGPNYRKVMQAMTIALQARPKCLLVATFGTIARADVMAQGLADAIKELRPDIPIVAAIRGTGEEEAAKILQSVGLESFASTEETVQQAVHLMKGVRS